MRVFIEVVALLFIVLSTCSCASKEPDDNRFTCEAGGGILTRTGCEGPGQIPTPPIKP